MYQQTDSNYISFTYIKYIFLKFYFGCGNVCNTLKTYYSPYQ
jgi:hypothetical protein